MPIYEYKCPEPDCGHEVEDMFKMSDPPPPCSKCKEEGKDTVMELGVSKGSFKLKGGSWAKSGYE